MFLYFESSGCIILSIGRKIQGFKVKVSALHHLPLYLKLVDWSLFNPREKPINETGGSVCTPETRRLTHVHSFRQANLWDWVFVCTAETRGLVYVHSFRQANLCDMVNVKMPCILTYIEENNNLIAYLDTRRQSLYFSHVSYKMKSLMYRYILRCELET